MPKKPVEPKEVPSGGEGKILNLQFEIHTDPELPSYIGLVDENGEKLGDGDLWEGSELFDDEWDDIIAEVIASGKPPTAEKS